MKSKKALHIDLWTEKDRGHYSDFRVGAFIDLNMELVEEIARLYVAFKRGMSAFGASFGPPKDGEGFRYEFRHSLRYQPPKEQYFERALNSGANDNYPWHLEVVKIAEDEVKDGKFNVLLQFRYYDGEGDQYAFHDITKDIEDYIGKGGK